MFILVLRVKLGKKQTAGVPYNIDKSNR